jgi:hypothetical protein
MYWIGTWRGGWGEERKRIKWREATVEKTKRCTDPTLGMYSGMVKYCVGDKAEKSVALQWTVILLIVALG